MAQDDTRRYCLDCSRESPKLVAMVCPSLERQRAQSRQRSAQKQTAKRRKDVAARYSLAGGQDSRPITRRVGRLRTWVREGSRSEYNVRRKVNSWARTTLDLSDKALSEDEYAMRVISRCARISLIAEGRTDTISNRDSLIRAAGCEYFGLDWQDVLARQRVIARLTGREMNSAAAILDAAAAHNGDADNG